jgi:hypothetical protein
MLRTAVVGAVVVAAALFGVRQAPPITTDSDFVVTELYTELATRGQLLSGAYSRFGWKHPGPLYFYLQAPLYAASGHHAASLFAVAVAINLAAILTLACVARRDHGPLVVLLALACLIFAWRVPRLLASPWTAHVPVMAMMAFVTICGAVVSGRYRLLPPLMIFGSFVTQTHVGYVPVVGLLSVAAIASVVARRRRRSVGILAVSAGTWLLVWLPPLGDAWLNSGGNLALLWRFFVTEGVPAFSTSDALVYWSHGLAGVLRADLSLPWGGHFEMTSSFWAVPLALAQLAGLTAVAIGSVRAGRGFEGWLAGSAALASSAGFWAITRIQGDVLDHELFWLSALGALNLAILGAGAVRVVGGDRLRAWMQHPRVMSGAGGLVLIGCALIRRSARAHADKNPHAPGGCAHGRAVHRRAL